MSAAYPRRTERIKLRRNVQLVFRSPRGRVDCVPAATFAVNCHGVGLYALHQYPLGSEVFVMDSRSGVGAWGKLVWEGEQLRDGRIPVGVEFNKPGNHWKTRLVPPSWLPFLGGRAASQRPYMHASSNKVVLVGRGAVEPKDPKPSQPGIACRCCGCMEEVSVVEGQEPVCKVCREWVA
jgi:hypothetical protein